MTLNFWSSCLHPRSAGDYRQVSPHPILRSAMDWTQCLVHARKALYPLRHVPSPKMSKRGTVLIHSQVHLNASDSLVGWLVILKELLCLPLIMELIFNILGTRTPSDVPLLFCQARTTLAKASVEAYWLWREFACVGVSRNRDEGCPQHACVHDHRWQCFECPVPFQAVSGSQWNELGSCRCPSPHLWDGPIQSLFLMMQIHS